MLRNNDDDDKPKMEIMFSIKYAPNSQVESKAQRIHDEYLAAGELRADSPQPLFSIFKICKRLLISVILSAEYQRF